MKKDRFLMLLVFLLALGIGFAYLKFGPDFSPTADSKVYDSLALSLAEGKGFSLDDAPSARVAPGYPLFLAAIYKTFGHDYGTVRIIQILVLGGMAALLYLIARKYLNLPPTISFLASGLVIIWPYFLLYSSLILTEIFFTFSLLIVVYFLFKFWKRETYKNSLVAGIFLGITLYIRPVVLLLPIWVLFFLLAFKKLKKESLEWKKILLLFFVAVLILSPWTIRNYVRLNSFIPLATGVEGSIFYKSALIKAFLHYDYTQGSEALEPSEANLKTMALARLKNIYLFWNPGAEGTRAQAISEKYPWANNLFLVYKIIFFLILATAFLSLRFIKRKEIFLLWAIIFYFWALHILIYPYPRYTLPIMPLVILLALVTLSRGGKKPLEGRFVKTKA